jgi:hypothetical protein
MAYTCHLLFLSTLLTAQYLFTHLPVCVCVCVRACVCVCFKIDTRADDARRTASAGTATATASGSINALDVPPPPPYQHTATANSGSSSWPGSGSGSWPGSGSVSGSGSGSVSGSGSGSGESELLTSIYDALPLSAQAGIYNELLYRTTRHTAVVFVALPVAVAVAELTPETYACVDRLTRDLPPCVVVNSSVGGVLTREL